MLKYNLTGLPFFGAGNTGAFNDATKKLEITQATSPDVTLSSIVRASLGLVSSALAMVIDPIIRLIYASDSAAPSPTANHLKIYPTPGQSGRSLTWDSADTTGTIPSELTAALNAVNAAVLPKRSVESQITALLEAVPEEYKDKVSVTLDQNGSGLVMDLHADAAARAAYVNAFWSAASGANKLRISLSGAAINTDQVGDTSLPFEGGPVTNS